jgi:hypothetical protein
MPVLKATVSANANSGLWQLAQLMLESFESYLSLNSFLPRSALVLICSTGCMNEKFAARISSDTTIVKGKNLFMRCKNSKK